MASLLSARCSNDCDHELTREHFITATRMFREMDMRFWLEKAEAEQKA